MEIKGLHEPYNLLIVSTIIQISNKIRICM
nr:MAG TPA: hypothetical protein [Inoviridae sp.]